MKKKELLKLASIGMAALPLMSSCQKTPEAADKPNILIILTDDQGYGDVGFHQIHAPEISTPGMDQIAENGLIFTNGYVTGYNCAPSRVGLMTGRYQQRTGFYQARDSREGVALTNGRSDASGR